MKLFYCNLNFIIVLKHGQLVKEVSTLLKLGREHRTRLERVLGYVHCMVIKHHNQVTAKVFVVIYKSLLNIKKK